MPTFLQADADIHINNIRTAAPLYMSSFADLTHRGHILFALMQEQHILAHKIIGTRYDCGSKLGYLKATMAYGMKHCEVGEEFSAYLKNLKS